jgi:mannose-6-phosphate isomerase-like protein (cupin superfamily)
MPEFRQAGEIEVEQSGDGWEVSTLADARHVPGMDMVARRWRFEPGAQGPEEPWLGPAERFLYVISGSGLLLVGGRTSAIGRESMVWIERGDRYRLVAGEGPLEILEATSSRD